MALILKEPVGTLTFERNSRDKWVPGLRKLEPLLRAHLKAIVAVALSYRIADQGDGNPGLRVTVMTCAKTDPVDALTEDAQRSRWATFEAALDAEWSAFQAELEEERIRASASRGPSLLIPIEELTHGDVMLGDGASDSLEVH